VVYKDSQGLRPRTVAQRTHMPIAAEGWPFIIPLLGAGGILWLGGLTGGGVFLLLLAGAVCFFFRDPERMPPAEAGAILAPADGRVVRIGPTIDGRRGTEVSIFLSLFDVHINRAPCAGRVREVVVSPGRFVVAWKSEASAVNARTLIHLQGVFGDIFVRQVAGVLARRIVTRVRPGQEVRAGERIGMIRFGSRVDLLLPDGVATRVQVGDHVRGGESIIGVVA